MASSEDFQVQKREEYRDWTDVCKECSEEARLKGEDLLREGKVACLILAGGQGSRLGVTGPKGTFSVSALQKKSLFQILFEKILYAGIRAGRKLPVAVMTSSFNHKETVDFLSFHNFFGVSERQVYIFSQGNLPVFDTEGNPMFDGKGALIEAPDGNGRALHALYASGVLGTFKEAGIEYVNMVQVDNPLADPFDADLIGFHAGKGSDISMITVAKESESESAGFLVSKEGELRVVEYSEKKGGSFSFLNIGLYCFTVDFIEKIGRDNVALPLHTAHKKIDDTRFGSKSEYFIFDIFCYAKKIDVLLKERDECFSPLKNLEGKKGLEEVRDALIRKDQNRYFAITGKKTDGVLELSQALYYPTKEDLISWEEKHWPETGYVTP